MEEMNQKVTESTKITIKDVEIVSVTSPSTIDMIAKDKGLNPQEVYVRCTFKYNDNLFTASNKLRFLTKTGYKELLDARDNKKKLTFTVDVDKGFFYIEHNVDIDALFKDEIKVENNRVDLKKLIG